MNNGETYIQWIGYGGAAIAAGFGYAGLVHGKTFVGGFRNELAHHEARVVRGWEARVAGILLAAFAIFLAWATYTNSQVPAPRPATPRAARP
jgi:hypothetical protein